MFGRSEKYTSGLILLAVCSLSAGLCAASAVPVLAQTTSSPSSAALTKKRTTLLLPPLPSAKPGESVAVSADLVERYKRTPLTNKWIIFTFDGKYVGGASTADNGRATLELTVPAGTRSGSRKLVAEFKGDDEFFKINGNGSVRVVSPPAAPRPVITSPRPVGGAPTSSGGTRPVPARLELQVADAVLYATTDTVKYHGNIVFSATLTRGDKPVSGVTITFKAPSYTTRAVTGPDGVASISVKDVTITVQNRYGIVEASGGGLRSRGRITVQNTNGSL